ncbi:hypothetical protein MMC18_008944 [Xylographa bjoerkii]|nr:hypothetical protein [Xylographa bjoerkii]
MPGRSYNHPVDVDPNIRRSIATEARPQRNRNGTNNRRASAIPMPMHSEYSGREFRPVPEHIEEQWSPQNQYSFTTTVRAPFDAGPAHVPTSAHFSTSQNGFITGPSHLFSGLRQSPVAMDGPGYFEARGRHPSRMLPITHDPRSGLNPPTVASPRPTPVQRAVDGAAHGMVVRRYYTDGFVQMVSNTATRDGWDFSMHPSSTDDSSSMNSVDFRELEYVDAVDQNLVCPICQCPMVEPVETECGHTFCSQCLCTALDHQGDERTCPSCRKSFPIVNLDPVNNLVHRILDDLVVRCVSKNKGCLATMARSNILDHVKRHCGFSDIACPDIRCLQTLQRRQATDDQCHHGAAICDHCPEVMAELELDEHMRTSCEHRVVACHECDLEMHTDQVEEHKITCPEAIIQCDAFQYGCTFASQREAAAAHATVCPLSMLCPYLEAQENRFQEHEEGLKRMQRQNNIYKEFMATVEDSLARLIPPPMPGVPPYHGLSQPAHSSPGQVNHEPASHLLSLHESLREDVARVRNAVSEVDARANTISINDNLRHAEEMSHLNATIANLRTQVQWLISSQRQRTEQRALRSQTTGGDGQLQSGSMAGSSTDPDSGGVGLGPIRRPSDHNRQDPKL